jgi:hypothetical protein
MDPLCLVLHPLLPLRAPLPGRVVVTYGFGLRLEDGPAVHPHDPLLRAFGATVVTLEDEDEPLQADGFDPGQTAELVVEDLDGDGDPIVGVWDRERLRRAGSLPYKVGAMVAAAGEHALTFEALAVAEERTFLDDRRVKLHLLIHAPALVRARASGEYRRPVRTARRRIVLFADGTAEPRWWDPSAGEGPGALPDVPVSTELAEALDELRESYAKLREPLDDFDRAWLRNQLESRTRELWCRARAELGRTYAVGLLGPGMSRPVWRPEEVDSDDDEIPF